MCDVLLRVCSPNLSRRRDEQVAEQVAAEACRLVQLAQQEKNKQELAQQRHELTELEERLEVEAQEIHSLEEERREVEQERSEIDREKQKLKKKRDLNKVRVGFEMLTTPSTL